MTTLARRAGDESGFTIIETMVAIVILAFAFTGFAGVHAVASKAQSVGQNRGFAVAYANQDLEQARRTRLADVAAASTSRVTQGVQFNLARAVADVTAGKLVTSTVTWTDRFGAQSVSLRTVVSGVTNP